MSAQRAALVCGLVTNCFFLRIKTIYKVLCFFHTLLVMLDLYKEAKCDAKKIVAETKDKAY